MKKSMWTFRPQWSGKDLDESLGPNEVKHLVSVYQKR